MLPPLVEQQCFPDAVHFRARLWVQWGQQAAWHMAGARGWGWQSCSQGLLQAEGLLSQLQPWDTHTLLHATAPREAEQQPQPGATGLVCSTRQRRGSDTRWHSPSLTSRKDEGSHLWQTPQWHYRSWDLHFDPHQVTTNKLNLHTQQLPQLLHYWNKTDCPLLTSSTVGFTACRDLWYKLLLFVIHSLEIQESASIIPDYNV